MKLKFINSGLNILNYLCFTHPLLPVGSGSGGKNHLMLSSVSHYFHPVSNPNTNTIILYKPLRISLYLVVPDEPGRNVGQNDGQQLPRSRGGRRVVVGDPNGFLRQQLAAPKLDRGHLNTTLLKLVNI